MIQPLTIGSPLPTTSHSQNGSFRHDSQGPSPKPAQLEIPTAWGRKKERKHAALLALSVACLLAEGTISCHPPLSKHLAAARAAQVIQLQPEPGQPKESSESWEEWRDRPEVGGGSRDSGETPTRGVIKPLGPFFWIAICCVVNHDKAMVNPMFLNPVSGC